MLTTVEVMFHGVFCLVAYCLLVIVTDDSSHCDAVSDLWVVSVLGHRLLVTDRDELWQFIDYIKVLRTAFV